MTPRGGSYESKRASDVPAAGRGDRSHHLAQALTSVALALAILGGSAAFAAKPVADSARPPSDDLFQPAEAVLSGLPGSILGMEANRMASSALVTYDSGPLDRRPKVGVTAVLWTAATTERKMRSYARGRFQRAGLNRILREGSFTTPKWPAARTFFGEYATANGFKQSWTVETGSERIGVIATYYDKADSQRLQGEVGDKIFGGAVITASRPTE